jgi:hypothetical protein
MGPSLIFGHDQIMPEIAPLRQVPPGSASKGGHSSPSLKAWGFLASFINIFYEEISLKLQPKEKAQ